MIGVLQIVAFVSATVLGMSASWCLLAYVQQRERKRLLRIHMQGADALAKIHVKGVARTIISTLLRLSLDQRPQESRQSSRKNSYRSARSQRETLLLASFLPGQKTKQLERITKRKMDRAALILQSGLHADITERGWQQTQRYCMGIGCASGALIGSIVSLECAAIAALVGVGVGARLTDWALSCERRIRSTILEAHLPEMLEVLCLGLRSGASFERALQVYCRGYSTTLAQELQEASFLWLAGLATKEEALKNVAASYDSAILGRVMDNVIRSIRFGSPLAEGLEALACEARVVRKARLEEAVMKAPVHMMVPIGTLILPSMMLLVLGPVLLEVSGGW